MSDKSRRTDTANGRSEKTRRRHGPGHALAGRNCRSGRPASPPPGYGFIKPDDGGRDVFVHITAVELAGLKDLIEGQRITFEVEPDKKGKGPKAVNLVITA